MSMKMVQNEKPQILNTRFTESKISQLHSSIVIKYCNAMIKSYDQSAMC